MIPLSTNPRRADQSKVRLHFAGGIEAGGQMKCPRTAGLGDKNENPAVARVAPFFHFLRIPSRNTEPKLDPVLWCRRCIGTSAS